MIPYIIAAEGLLMLALGFHLLDEVRRGARYRRFSALTEIVTGAFFVVLGLSLRRFPSVLKFVWVIAALILVLAAWQVMTTVRGSRARRRSEAERFNAAAGVAGPDVKGSSSQHG